MTTSSVATSAYWEAQEIAIASMNTVNHAIADLVDAIAMLIDTDGWGGVGIRSVEHWVTWKAGVSPRRAQRLCTIARRRDDLPQLWGLFRDGRLTEDVMGRLAAKLPAARDAEMARLAPELMVTQLNRILRWCPEQPDGPPKQGPRERQRTVHARQHDDGWVVGSFTLPPEEGVIVLGALHAGRDAELRDRKGVTDEEVTEGQLISAGVSWADGFVRVCGEALDALDRTLQRAGVAGDRHHLVLHREVGADGLGPAQVHLGPVLDDAVARFFTCDARVTIQTYADGRLVGLHPAQRTVSRSLRRAIEQRDQGCVHPLCQARRWLHVHHLRHWEAGGLTIPSNLCCLCPAHHREHHRGLFTIEGDPETEVLVFRDQLGRAIGPPAFGPTAPRRPAGPATYTQPYGGPMGTGAFEWRRLDAASCN